MAAAAAAAAAVLSGHRKADALSAADLLVALPYAGPVGPPRPPPDGEDAETDAADVGPPRPPPGMHPPAPIPSNC